MTPSVAPFDLWIRRYHPSPRARARLLCLPQAGGAASFFRTLSAALAPSVEVLAVQYPGRQDRYSEPPLGTIAELADAVHPAVAPLDDLPLAVFGHSMGAVIGFELARRMQREGRPPAVLFASGRRSPLRHRDERVHTLDDAAFLAEIRALGGTSTAVLDDEELRAIVMPALRGDYRAAETYRAAAAEPLRCPIVVLTGDRDPRVSLSEAREWERETTAPFRMEVLPGGHFYLVGQEEQVAGHLRRHLAALAA